MADGYTDSDDYLNIGEVDKIIVDALIGEQGFLETNDAPLPNTDIALSFTYL